MCTVTFLPNGNDGFTLTSNRDEAPSRKTLAPQLYLVDGIKLLFPKDAEAGGTWIGLSERNRLICLLNGGFVGHEHESSYRLSRGIIVTHLLKASNVIEAINDYDFKGIEPFTIVLVDWNVSLSLHELVWDGTETHLHEKPLAPQIWSSSLLYAPEAKAERMQWFSSFLFKNLRPSTAEILDFHTLAGKGDMENGLIMDRVFVKTKSITQVHFEDQIATMQYRDLKEQIVNTVTL